MGSTENGRGDDEGVRRIDSGRGLTVEWDLIEICEESERGFNGILLNERGVRDLEKKRDGTLWLLVYFQEDISPPTLVLI